jgi:hypothetical protein
MKIIYSTSRIFIVALLLNLWWIIPFFTTTFKEFGSSSTVNYSIFTGGGFYEVFRFLRSWAFKCPEYVSSYIHLYYNNPLVIACTYIIPIIAFSSLLFLSRVKQEKRKSLFFFIALAMVSLFLTKGPIGPFGSIYNFLYRHFPFFYMYREPYTKFTPINLLCLSVLFGFSTGVVFEIIKTKAKRMAGYAFSFVIILVVCISAFPIFTGEIIFDGERGSAGWKGGRSAHVKIPDYWFQTGEWISRNPDEFRVFTTPRPTGCYLWESGFNIAGPAAMFFTTKPILSFGPASTNSDYIVNQTYNMLISGSAYIPNLLRLFNVKYVLQQNDLYSNPEWRFFAQGYLPPERMGELLRMQRRMKFLKTVGKLDLYEISKKYFLPRIYSAKLPIIVSSPEVLEPISHTEYLDDKPVILFSDRVKETKWGIGVLVDQIQNSNFVFKDSNWQDLAIQIAGQRLQVASQEAKVKIEKHGIYEVFVQDPATGSRVAGIEIDARKMAVGDRLQNIGRKYARIGEIDLKAGEHVIKGINGQKPVTGEGEGIILVDKEERLRIEELIRHRISQQGIGACYVFEQGGEFYVSQGADYIIKAKASPHFVKKKDIVGVEFKFGLEELKNWSFSSSEVTYDYSTTGAGALLLSSYFDGDKEEDEYVRMRREGLKIDLEKYPWFELTYRVEDPGVQTIEVVLGMDFDRDGVVDEHISSIYPKAAITEFDKFSYPALGKVKKHFPDMEHYDLLLLELYPHKFWGVDCKSLMKRRSYQFYIRKLQFYNYAPKNFFEVADYALNSNFMEKEEFSKWKVTSNMKDYSCNFQNENLVVTARFKRGIGENITLSRTFNLDLEKFPFVELEYKVNCPTFQDLEVILSLDFDKDGIADKDVFSSLTLDTNLKNFELNALEVAKAAYPEGKHYHLLQIGLRLKRIERDFLRVNWEYSWYLKGIKIYSTSFVLPSDFIFDKPVFEVDGEKYWFRKKFQDEKETEYVVFTRGIHLKKGGHSISSLLKGGDNFKVDWVVIEPVGRDLQTENEPKIVFRKVNPAKYEVEVKEAKAPFWLVFSESFHEDWRIYLSGAPDSHSLGEIAADYPELGVKEGIHSMKFTPQDIKHLFRETDIKGHCLVNGYANGWYVEPEKLGLGENFKLVLYFWPQSRFYLGLGISGLTLIGCIGYLGVSRRRKK